MKKWLFYTAGILGLSLLLVGCKNSDEKAKDTNQGLNIVTTFYPMYDFTKNVAGDDAKITMLIDGTVEPHDYEPSAKDIAKIQDADVFIYNSKEMETWVTKVLDSVDQDKLTVIDASKGIELAAGDSHAHDHDGHEHGEAESHDHDGEDKDDAHHEGLHVHGTKDHYHTGDKVTLEAHGQDAHEFDHFQWFEKKDGEKDFSPIKDATEGHYHFEVKKNSELQLRLLDKADKTVSETEPIVININDHHDEKDETDETAKEEGHSHEGHSHAYDPHVWLDPVLAVKEVENICEGLSKAAPQKKADFEKNADSFIDKLDKLNMEYDVAFRDAKNRIFVTQHAAFGYLARQYDLTQESISGISPDNEPSASQLAAIETFVKEHKVKVIYTEELSSKKIAETIAKATGAKMATLNTLEGLSQEEQDAGEDYISVMEQNLEALKLSIN